MDEISKTVEMIAGSKMAEKIYSDALSPSLKQVGALSEDLLKTLRLFTAPIQLLATYQDRLSLFLERTVSKVPEDRQQEAPASIAGPVLERVRYLHLNEHLTELFSNLLARAIDTDRQNEAHPAFVQIISELSADEALLLQRLYKGSVSVRRVPSKRHRRQFGTFYRSVVADLQHVPSIVHPENLGPYIEHLYSMGLIGWRARVPTRSRLMPTEIDLAITKSIYLTKFGLLFVRACCDTSSAH